MPDSTPRFAIPYPVASDPAYMFPIIQDTAQEIEDTLSSIAATIGSSIAGKATLKSIGWVPTVTGLVVGNGVQTASAYAVGDLIVCVYSLAAAAAAPTTAYSGSAPLMLSLPILSDGPASYLCTYTDPRLSPPNLVFTITVEPNATNARISGMTGSGSLNLQSYPVVAGGGASAWVVGQKLSTVFIYRVAPGSVILPVWSNVIAGAPARPGDPSPVDWAWVIANFTNWSNTISGTRIP